MKMGWSMIPEINVNNDPIKSADFGHKNPLCAYGNFWFENLIKIFARNFGI